VSDLKETRGPGHCRKNRRQTRWPGPCTICFSGLGVQATAAARHIGPIAGVFLPGTTFWGWLLRSPMKLRPRRRSAVAELKSPWPASATRYTGDRAAEAQRVAAKINLTDVHAEALPAQKMEFVLAEIKKGYRPMVVGDGINDALALKVGAVGIRDGCAGYRRRTRLGRSRAHDQRSLRRLGTCVRLSRRCRRTILVNVGVGLGWTVIVIAGAASGISA